MAWGLESVVLPQQSANETRKRSRGCQASVASSLHASFRGFSAPGPQQEAQCLANQRWDRMKSNTGGY
tara:strand:- start:105 stop:308 length:204 start_codon:yes stop_codon:yes gene_type:complete